MLRARDNYDFLFLEVSSVKRLIREKEDIDKYRIDELVVSIFLAAFCGRIWKTECMIGFPLKISEADSIPSVNRSNLKDVKNILNVKSEQDYDVALVIVNHTPDSSERTGQGLQIKQFNTYQSDITTSGLIKYIQKQEIRYVKTDTALVILLETGELTKFTQIHDSINPKKFPFSRLYFVGLYGNKLRFIEVWPNLGKEEIEWSSV